MKSITYYTEESKPYAAGDFGTLIEDDFILFVGTAAEIKALYRAFDRQWNFIPDFCGFPKFNEFRMYGITVYPKPNGNDFGFSVIGESVVCRLLYDAA